MLVTLPFVLLLLDYWPLGRCSGWRTVLEKIPLLGLSAAASLVALYAQQQQGAMTMAGQYPFFLRAANGAAAYLAYLGKTIWPNRLSVMYPHPGPDISPLQWISGAALVLLLAVLALGLRRRFPWLTTGALWFLGTLVPVIGLVQVGEQAFADRYTYVPLIGVFLAAAWGLGALFSSLRLRRRLAAAAIAALCVLGALAARQVSFWKDNATLYRHAIAAAPGSWLMHANLGGELSGAGALEEALPHMREVVRLRPELGEAHNNLALVLDRLGRTEEAVREYRETLRIIPCHPTADGGLGLALVRLGRPQEAIAHLQRATGSRPDDPALSYYLGVSLDTVGRSAEAVPALRAAVRLQPENAFYRRILDSVLARTTTQGALQR